MAWAVGVSQAQAGGAHSVNAMVEQMIMFGGQLVNTVNVDRRATVFLVKRQVKRFAINLPGTGVDDLYVGIEIAAGFEQGELGLAVQLQIVLGKQHRIQVAHIRRQVEN